MLRERLHSLCREHAFSFLHGRTQEGVAVFNWGSRTAYPPLAAKDQPGCVHFAGRRFSGLLLAWLVAKQKHFSLNRAASKKANSYQSVDDRMKEAV
jgi:hypothetical protein